MRSPGKEDRGVPGQPPKGVLTPGTTRPGCFTSGALLFVQHLSFSLWSCSPSPALFRSPSPLSLPLYRQMDKNTRINLSYFCVICIEPLDGAMIFIFPKMWTCLFYFLTFLKGKFTQKEDNLNFYISNILDCKVNTC